MKIQKIKCPLCDLTAFIYKDFKGYALRCPNCDTTSNHNYTHAEKKLKRIMLLNKCNHLESTQELETKYSD